MKELIEAQELLTATADGALVDSACLLHHFRITNIDKGAPGLVVLLRNGVLATSSIKAVAALPNGAAASSVPTELDPPARFNGIYVDFTTHSGAAGSGYAELGITRLEDDPRRLQNRAGSDPSRAFAGRGVNQPLFTSTRGGLGPPSGGSVGGSSGGTGT